MGLFLTSKSSSTRARTSSRPYVVRRSASEKTCVDSTVRPSAGRSSDSCCGTWTVRPSTGRSSRSLWELCVLALEVILSCSLLESPVSALDLVFSSELMLIISNSGANKLLSSSSLISYMPFSFNSIASSPSSTTSCASMAPSRL